MNEESPSVREDHLAANDDFVRSLSHLSYPSFDSFESLKKAGFNYTEERLDIGRETFLDLDVSSSNP